MENSTIDPFGPSTSNLGDLYAMIIGRTTHLRSDDSRLSNTNENFQVVSDGFTLYRSADYNWCVEYCNNMNLKIVDCTT